MTGLKIGVLFGGCSVEHEVSIRSARTIIDGLKQANYSPTPIGVQKDGTWLNASDSIKLLNGEALEGCSKPGPLAKLSALSDYKIDLLFPIIHGAFGEDGCIQGLCRILGLPYVGPGVLGSALCMDKEMTKRVLLQAGINVVPFKTATQASFSDLDLVSIVKELGEPLFVKPANLGSSVGISKATSSTLHNAITSALQFDRKVIIEKGIKGRELECSVLGNENPTASVVGEVVPGEAFYSYDDKYAANSKAQTLIPADLDEEVSNTIRSTAIRAFQALDCEGMARVDFFLSDKGELFINEINTIPGFTSISMYPKMWEAAGVKLPALLTELVELGLKRHARDGALKTSP